MTPEDEIIRAILMKSRNVAVVGISDRPERPSHGVAQYLTRYYDVLPVNPQLSEWGGKRAYASLNDIAGSIDIVNVFRKSDAVIPIAEEAIAREAKCLWLQIGVINDEAKRLAEDAGIIVVMDRCIAVEHSRLCRAF